MGQPARQRPSRRPDQGQHGPRRPDGYHEYRGRRGPPHASRSRRSVVAGRYAGGIPMDIAERGGADRLLGGADRYGAPDLPVEADFGSAAVARGERSATCHRDEPKSAGFYFASPAL